MQVDSSNSWLLECVSGTGSLNAIPIDPFTDQEVQEPAIQTKAIPKASISQIVVAAASATTQRVTPAMGENGTAVVPFDTMSDLPLGRVANIPVLGAAGEATALALDPDGRYLFVTEAAAFSGLQGGGLRVFLNESGGLTEVPHSPFATGDTRPSAVVANTTNV